MKITIDIPTVTTMEFNEIYDFLAYRRYPNGFSKNQKRILRRKNAAHFRVRRGMLFYSKMPKSVSGGKKLQWRQVPRTTEEKNRILEACHSSNEGT